MPGRSATQSAPDTLLEHLSDTMGDGVLASSTLKEIVVGPGMLVYPSCALC